MTLFDRNSIHVFTVSPLQATDLDSFPVNSVETLMNLVKLEPRMKDNHLLPLFDVGASHIG